MNCTEIRELLLPFSDGELDDEQASRVAAELDSCPGCRAELDEIEAVRALAREALLAPIEGVDLSGVYDGVMARLEAEAAPEAARAVVRDEPGLLDRLSAWIGDLFTFQQPMVSLATFAALAIVVGGVWWSQEQGPAGVGPPSPVVADNESPSPPTVAPSPNRRRGAEGEFVASTEAVIVESIEASGEVEIDVDDPEGAVIVWHIVDDNATQAPEREL